MAAVCGHHAPGGLFIAHEADEFVASSGIFPSHAVFRQLLLTDLPRCFHLFQLFPGCFRPLQLFAHPPLLQILKEPGNRGIDQQKQADEDHHEGQDIQSRNTDPAGQKRCHIHAEHTAAVQGDPFPVTLRQPVESAAFYDGIHEPARVDQGDHQKDHGQQDH